MYSILYPDSLTNDDFLYEKPIAKNKCELIKFNASHAEEIPNDVLKNADGLITGLKMTIDKKVIDQLSKCKIITRLGVGYDLIDIQYCGSKGIVVSNVPDYGTYEVADHAMAMIMNFARGISSYNDKLKSNLTTNWNFSLVNTIERLVDKNVGIIGLGRIGTAFALRAKAFGFNIKFYDPYVPDGQEKALNIERCNNLEELISDIDYLSIHCLANKETENLINSKILNMCKSNLTIINTARGVIINLDDAYTALKNGKLGALGLDVFPNEPPNKNHPLVKAWLNEDWAKEKIIFTPHSAFYSPTGLIFLREKALKTCLDHLEDIKTANCVNKEYLNNKR